MLYDTLLHVYTNHLNNFLKASLVMSVDFSMSLSLYAKSKFTHKPLSLCAKPDFDIILYI